MRLVPWCRRAFRPSYGKLSERVFHGRTVLDHHRDCWFTSIDDMVGVPVGFFMRRVSGVVDLGR